MTSMYHSHSHHLGFNIMPNSTNTTLLENPMQTNHSNLFNQSNLTNNLNCHSSSNTLPAMSNSHLQNSQSSIHQMQTNINSSAAAGNNNLNINNKQFN